MSGGTGPSAWLKTLARLPIASDTWLGFGHAMDNEEDFAENTKLCAAILTPQGTEDGSEVCRPCRAARRSLLPGAPLYRDELEYKLAHDADALLDKMVASALWRSLTVRMPLPAVPFRTGTS